MYTLIVFMQIMYLCQHIKNDEAIAMVDGELRIVKKETKNKIS